MVIKGFASALIGVEAKTVTVEANATTTPDFATFIIEAIAGIALNKNLNTEEGEKVMKDKGNEL